MSYSRYTNVPLFTNRNPQYKAAFYNQRGIKQLYQYSVPRIFYPSATRRENLENIPLVWKATDTLYNISHRYYGSPQYWWVVAWYNKRASEAEFSTGDVYYVPLPIEDVLGYF
jgi:hypothetical protein